MRDWPADRLLLGGDDDPEQCPDGTATAQRPLVLAPGAVAVVRENGPARAAAAG